MVKVQKHTNPKNRSNAHSETEFNKLKREKRGKKPIKKERIKQASKTVQNNDDVFEQAEQYLYKEPNLKSNRMFDQLVIKQKEKNQIKDMDKDLKRFNEILPIQKQSPRVFILQKPAHQALLNEHEEIKIISEKEQALFQTCRELSKNQPNRSQKFLSQTSKIVQENRRGRSMNFQKALEESQIKYFGILARVTFNHALSEDPIDYLNYFKFAAYCQQEKFYTPYQPITSNNQLVEYLSKRKNKLRKAAKFLLYSACNSCLSPHFQQSNPLTNCPECHMRIHQLCLNLTRVQRCGRCIYNRISVKDRENIQECFICETKELIPQRISGKLFAHTFCLIGCRIQKIVENTISLDPQAQKKFKVINACVICGKESKFTLQCSKCGKFQHLLCSYFAGSSIRERNFQLPQIYCCLSEEKKQLLSKKRKYIVNYNNFAYNLVGKGKRKDEAEQMII